MPIVYVIVLIIIFLFLSSKIDKKWSWTLQGHDTTCPYCNSENIVRSKQIFSGTKTGLDGKIKNVYKRQYGCKDCGQHWEKDEGDVGPLALIGMFMELGTMFGDIFRSFSKNEENKDSESRKD